MHAGRHTLKPCFHSSGLESLRGHGVCLDLNLQALTHYVFVYESARTKRVCCCAVEAAVLL